MEDLEYFKECLPSIDFDDLWNLKPNKRHKVYMIDHFVEVPRYSQSYINSYTYSGNTNIAIELPGILQPILDFAQKYDKRFNQVLVNWYENGLHYIGPHSDDTRQLIEKSPIMSISFGQDRKFRIRNKISKQIVEDISVKNGDVLIMKNDFQKIYSRDS